VKFSGKYHHHFGLFTLLWKKMLTECNSGKTQKMPFGVYDWTEKNITRCHYCWIQLLYFCVVPLLHSVSDIHFCLFLVVFIQSGIFSTCHVMLGWTYCLISKVCRHTMQYCHSVFSVMAVGTGWLVYLKGSSLSVIT
jgi:hypothetical protein